MRTKPLILTLALLLLLLGSHAATAQVVVRGNISFGGPARAYYGPRYYPPRPVVVYAVPPPVVVAPYYAPRPYYYAPAPRPYYGYRGGRGYGRRW